MPIDNSSRFPKPLAADLRELSEGMAIVIDGNTAPKGITKGQYLFIKNHSTLATGGYHATAAIASGADVTSSNVEADPDGIVNGAVSALSDQIANDLSEYNVSLNSSYIANNYVRAIHVGNRLIVAGTFITGTTAISTATTLGAIVKGSNTLITIPIGSATVYLIQSNDFTTPYYIKVNTDGTIQPSVNALKASTWFSFTIILNLT